MSETGSKVYLQGLALAGYRSFGPKIQFMGPFSQINVFAGPNNVGKSNVLRYIHHHVTGPLFGRKSTKEALTPADIHRGHPGYIITGVPLLMDEAKLRATFPEWSGTQIAAALWLLDQPLLRHGTNMPWWFQETSLNKIDRMKILDLPEFANHLPAMDFNYCPLRQASWNWKRKTSSFRISDNEHFLNECLADLWQLKPDLPSIRYLPAIRQVSGNAASIAGLGHYQGGGHDLVGLFRRLTNPNVDEFDEAETILRAIYGFLSDLLGEPNISLKVPDGEGYFLIVRNGRAEHLRSLGSGFEHLIMLSIECAIRQNEMICLEEPEVFLHPILQRKLIQHLKTTTNQYFISTHSSQFLDISDASVFRLELKDGATIVDLAATPTQRFQICNDLGYRASDIVQSNCLIWVEGPSDRIYLKKWISEIDPDVREGIEYSLIFYGGSSQWWLSGEDPEEAERYISMVSINRHSAIVMDSDKESEEDGINDVKARLQTEIAGKNGYVWITDGREVENYTPFELRKTCVGRHNKTAALKMTDDGPFEFAYPKTPKGHLCVSKTTLATEISSEPVQWGSLGLRKRVFDLVNFIREANHIEKLSAAELDV